MKYTIIYGLDNFVYVSKENNKESCIKSLNEIVKDMLSSDISINDIHFLDFPSEVEGEISDGSILIINDRGEYLTPKLEVEKISIIGI